MARDLERATLADVARQAGVSKTAASLILNNREGSRLSEAATRRVREAAGQLGYKPNPHARSLRIGKTRSVGFISDEVTITRFASAMITGVLAAARELDHTVLIAETGGHGRDDVEQALEAMLDRRVDGIVIGLMAARLIELPDLPAALPVVVVNGSTESNLPNVYPDEDTAGRRMANLLIDAGHREIGLIGEMPRKGSDPRRSTMIPVRFQGIDGAFRAAGIAPVRARMADWTPDEGYSHARRMLTEHPGLTGLIAGNDAVAFGIYQALAEMGLRVPDDISVVSFDDEELASYLRPELTTARLPYDVMGRRGLEMVLGQREPTHDLVEMPIKLRGSVGPPPWACRSDEQDSGRLNACLGERARPRP